jgi:hypothetical protein
MVVLCESPIVFPLVQARCDSRHPRAQTHRVFVVNDKSADAPEGMRVPSVPADTHAVFAATYSSSSILGNNYGLGSGSGHQLHGSIHHIQPESNSKSSSNAILTITSHPENPRLLVVVVVIVPPGKQQQHSSSSRVFYIDVSPCEKYQQETVAAHCYPRVQTQHQPEEPEEGIICDVDMVLVDANGTIMVLTLSENKHDDDDDLQLVFQKCFSVSIPGTGTVAQGIRNTMVAFPQTNNTSSSSSRCILMSFNPFLVSVDIDQQITRTWSYSQTVDAMRTANSIYKTFTNLLLGKDGDETLLVDMAPVAAITTLYHQFENAIIVITLHADGILRYWKIKKQQPAATNATMLPDEVYEIPVRHMPLPAIWNDSHNSVYITAAQNSESSSSSSILWIAVHVATTVQVEPDEYIDGIDASQRQNSSHSHILILIEHDTSSTYQTGGGEDPKTHSIRLHLPTEMKALVGMQFDSRIHTIGAPPLHALILQTTDTDSITGNNTNSSNNMAMLTYPPSAMSILRREPDVLPQAYTLQEPSIAFPKHKNSILESAKMITSITTTTGELDESRLSTEELLEMVDRRFLQILFRPALPSHATYDMLPPSQNYILRAMAKISQHRWFYRNQSSLSPDNNPTPPIEVQVIAFLYQWRRWEQQKEQQHQIHTPRHATTPRSVQTNTLAPRTINRNSNNTGLSLYDMIGIDDDEVNSGETNHNHSAMDMESDDDNDENFRYDQHQKEKQVQAHEERWLYLLRLIFEEESIERIPLTFSLSSVVQEGEGGDDANDDILIATAIIVRPGCISVLNQHSHRSSPPQDPNKKNALLWLSKLDNLALYFWTHINGTESLESAENFAWEIVTSGKLALCPELIIQFQKILEKRPSLENILDEVQYEEFQQLSTVTKDQWISWMCETPLHGSTTSCFCLMEHACSYELRVSTGQPVADIQDRLVAAHIFFRCLYFARSLFLGRYLVLSHLGKDSIAAVALLMYLQAVSLQSVGAQNVPLPHINVLDESSRHLRLDNIMMRTDDDAARLHKRSKVVGVLESHGIKDKTTAIDALLIRLSQQLHIHQPSKNSLGGGRSLCLAKAALDATLSFDQRNVLNKPPELCIVPISKDQNAIEVPELAIRMIAPYLAVDSWNSSPEVLQRRKELMSDCLLLLSLNGSRTEQEAKQMVDQAFSLLVFDENYMEKSARHLSIFERRISDRNPQVGISLIVYIKDAIEKVTTSELLWSWLFRVAIAIRDWNIAFYACSQHPNVQCRADSFKRLVRAMVDAGALSELQQKCFAVHNEPNAFGSVVNLYGIATQTLSDIGFRDIYTAMLESFDPPSDYLAASFVLHVSQGQWKSAAQTLDNRFLNARKCLETHVPELSHESQLLRDRLIVDDIAASALNCHLVLQNVPDNHERYIVSGKSSSTASIPEYLKSKSIPPLKNGNGSTGTLMNMNDIEVRAIRSSALKLLFYESAADSTFAKSAFINDDGKSILNVDIIEKLFICGHYFEGLSLAKAIEKQNGCKPNGCGMFHETLSHLICVYLVPLVLDKNLKPPRPTLAQLRYAINSIVRAPGSPPTIVIGTRWKKLAARARSDIRTAAMQLIYELTMTYTSHEQPIASELALCMIENETVGVRCLPSWLEAFLLYGKEKMDVPGLFARRRARGIDGYMGDPSFLLSLYTHHGMLEEACRVVCAVLAGPDDSFREYVAQNRLPEKGEIDFVPYKKIDLLWNLIDRVLQKGMLSNVESRRLSDARLQMEKAVEKHFQLLEISEMGIRSARALL